MKKNQVGFGVSLVVMAVIVFSAPGSWAGRGSGPGMGGGGMGNMSDPGFISEHFSGSSNCSMCHNNLFDHVGTDVSIQKIWATTMMANSTRDPLWRAKVRSELNRNPQLANVINDKCSKCHAPMANYEAHYLQDELAIFNGGILDPDNLHYNEAFDGVSCTLCHQIVDSPRLGSLAGYSGGYEINTYDNSVDRELYGQYMNIATQPMRNNVQYTPLFSEHISASRICATCHNLKTPYVDEHGEILSTTPESEFPEQMPYSEWEHSAYVEQKSCQDCHMPRTDGVVIASRPMWVSTPRDNFAVHRFAGGNLLMLEILDTNREALSVGSGSFADNLIATNELLQGAAKIELLQSSLVEGQLDFRFKISSMTGHKLPSGIPLRRIILHVTVQDNRGRVVFESGRINADGSVVGVNSDRDPMDFEPHYDLIINPDQVQVYEAIMTNNLDEVTYTLLRAMSYAKDNRLLPVGFDKASAEPDIQVAGGAQDDVNFQGGGDEISYRLGGLKRGSYSVSAELVFQPLAFPVLTDLTQDTDVEIEAFRNMYEAAQKKSSVISSLQFQVNE